MQMLKELNRTTAAQPQNRPVKVLQFGEGNFLRAFTDWIIDILNEKTDFNGAVQIVQPLTLGMGDLINKQDGLYHVVLNGIKDGVASRESRLITSVTGVLNPFIQFNLFLQQAENPDLKFIVSNTTEAGIAFNEKDVNPDILADSFPGKLTTLLYHRYKHFAGAASKGLVVMPCELIEKNGDALKQTIKQYISHWKLPEAFAQWIEDHNIFCNTLVDRIVPGFPKDLIKDIQSELGYEDNLVVMAEPFHLWVIEAPASVTALFPVNKTDLQVKFVDDLTPYRTRKVRILNGAHTVMVAVAYLSGLTTVQQALEDEKVGPFVKNVIYDEIIPTLDLPASELKTFAHDVLERFQNPFIRHELLSIALNSISKYKVRVLPSLLEYKARKGELPLLLVYSLTKLICFYKGEYKGTSIPLNDATEVLEFFKKVWAYNDVEKLVVEVLANKNFWGMDLMTIQGLKEQVVMVLKNKSEKEAVV